MDQWWVLALLGLVIIIYARFALRQRQSKIDADSQPSASNETLMKEMEDAIAVFVAEIQEENDLLIERIRRLKSQSDAKLEDIAKKEAAFEARIAQLEESVAEAKQAILHTASTQQHAPHTAAQRPLNIRERYKEVFALYDQNRPIEYIAEKTGLNKGEIQLVIQLADREAKMHVN